MGFVGVVSSVHHSGLGLIMLSFEVRARSLASRHPRVAAERFVALQSWIDTIIAP